MFLFVFFILSRRCPLLATFLSVLFCLLSLLISDSRFDLVWFRLSCDHGWIRSGSANVRKQQQQQQRQVDSAYIVRVDTSAPYIPIRKYKTPEISQENSLLHSAMATYSASIEDRATLFCVLYRYITQAPANTTIAPETDRRSVALLAKSESTKSSMRSPPTIPL